LRPQILILGFGNPGRQDDGLGPRCVALLENHFAKQQLTAAVNTDCNYQLTVEDALAISQVEKVIFIDAAIGLATDFQFTPIKPLPAASWNYHLLTPEGLLYLTDTLFNATPDAYLMAIKGYEFDQFGEKLSVQAEANMLQAYQFLTGKLDDWTTAAADSKIAS
jgi:hydrogenase maturation protease